MEVDIYINNKHILNDPISSKTYGIWREKNKVIFNGESVAIDNEGLIPKGDISNSGYPIEIIIYKKDENIEINFDSDFVLKRRHENWDDITSRGYTDSRYNDTKVSTTLMFGDYKSIYSPTLYLTHRKKSDLEKLLQIDISISFENKNTENNSSSKLLEDSEVLDPNYPFIHHYKPINCRYGRCILVGLNHDDFDKRVLYKYLDDEIPFKPDLIFYEDPLKGLTKLQSATIKYCGMNNIEFEPIDRRVRRKRHTRSRYKNEDEGEDEGEDDHMQEYIRNNQIYDNIIRNSDGLEQKRMITEYLRGQNPSFESNLQLRDYGMALEIVSNMYLRKDSHNFVCLTGSIHTSSMGLPQKINTVLDELHKIK